MTVDNACSSSPFDNNSSNKMTGAHEKMFSLKHLHYRRAVYIFQLACFLTLRIGYLQLTHHVFPQTKQLHFRSFSSLNVQADLILPCTKIADLVNNSVQLIHRSISFGTQPRLIANICSGDVTCGKSKGVQTRQRTAAVPISPWI